MNKTHLSSLFFVAFVMVLAIVALAVSRSGGNAQRASQAAISPGNLNRLEPPAASLSKIGRYPSTRFSIGIGDLRRFEAQQTASRKIGMGDLRRYEAQQSDISKIGMGDLRRFEATQQTNK